MSSPAIASSAPVSFWQEKWFIPAFGASGAVALLIASFVLTSKFVGSSTTWASIGANVNKIWIMSLIGSFLLFVASAVYFTQNNPKTVYFILFLLCITLGFSYSALAVSAITSL